MDWWLTLTIAVLAALPGLGALYNQQKKTRSEIGYTEANTSEKFEKIARDAAESILEKSDRIRALEHTQETMQDEIDLLKRENIRLAGERLRLENRVQKLENILRAHDIPVPLDGG